MPSARHILNRILLCYRLPPPRQILTGILLQCRHSLRGWALRKGWSWLSNLLQPNQDQEAQFAALDFWTGGGSHIKYLRLYLAAQGGDWKYAKTFIERDPNALTARIGCNSQTVLHVAAECWQWGFLLKLLELQSSESIAVQDGGGNTVLHFVAMGGSLKTAKALIKKNNELPQMLNDMGRLPLYYSISFERKEMTRYLILITKVESPVFPFFSPSLPEILRSLIESGYHDIALYFVQKCPEVALAKDGVGLSLLWWLACEPSHFLSGSNLGFLQRCIYRFIHVDMEKIPTHSVVVNIEDIQERPEGLSFATQVLQWFKRFLHKTIAQMAPFIETVRDTKLKHECAVELVNDIYKQLSRKSFLEVNEFLQDPPIIVEAIQNGIEEIVRTLLKYFPYLILKGTIPELNILQAAILFRQEKIINIIKDISPTITMALCGQPSRSNDTTLFLAAKLAPAFKLYSVSGAALQMQRELQWFKEVEKITHPSHRNLKNKDDQTAKDVFRIEHKGLAEQGEKWMKDTANFATVLFAAAFTVPGGNVNDEGIPVFLGENAFILFAVSDAVGLFSSLTALLMFLGILTARYEMEDFLRSLPKRLIIGLGSLFFAIVAMIIAFGASLTIVLSKRWHWVSGPITLLASFPVSIFVMLQLPLFIQMVQSTYGSSIFRLWPSRL